MERRHFWLLLFLIVLAYDLYLEHHFIFIYYTIQTFSLEILYFTAAVLEKAGHTRAAPWKKHLFDIVFAPSIVVCVGFWVVIAPTRIHGPKPRNSVFIVVTHGFNALAMLDEVQSVRADAIWKPVLYTFLYNLFLIAYVGAGGRSISGKLPYWYCEYDKPVGWIFALVSICAAALVHATSVRIWPLHDVPKRTHAQHVV